MAAKISRFMSRLGDKLAPVSFKNQWPIQIMLAGFAFALSFHLVHGLRHLLWDLGFGFEGARLHTYALWEVWLVFVVSVVAIVLI